MNYLLKCLILIITLISVPFSYAEEINDDVTEIKTSAGILRIENDPIDSQDFVKVFIDKKHLVFVGKGARWCHFKHRFTLPDLSDVIVIFENSGGSFCPGVYRFLTIKGKKLTDSGAAGNCSDLPIFEQKGSVISVSFPTNRPSKKDIWRYDNGKVTKIK